MTESPNLSINPYSKTPAPSQAAVNQSDDSIRTKSFNNSTRINDGTLLEEQLQAM